MLAGVSAVLVICFTSSGMNEVHSAYVHSTVYVVLRRRWQRSKWIFYPQEAHDLVAMTHVKQRSEYKVERDHTRTRPGVLEPRREEGEFLGKALVYLFM